ncbi:LacI family DNA-binding transcriptional regulator [Oenococcus sicerae]|uniref:LacI family DNA-binding transcriptional regulator n=1 Tax=Oenococcus sicerae TaxID=2203724 RepID=A0AAJ1R8Z6_9LACO|nr:LacI family DNA-binding transcriptional regulator [Oenococcus sicerae]MDN6899941.1 LacI family DNA-binding transcriptional regulator [Oenococcus sicerae]QAS69091.1 LacI family DNA-binding transcriptional regulator [Oenococcus sicerae]
MKHATISDVAKEVGVSATTISSFLNGRYNKMSSATRRKINDTIVQMNYRPFASARDMRSRQTKTIAVIMGDTSNLFSSFLFTGIYNVFQPLGYSVLLLNVSNAAREEDQGIDRLLAQRVDGLIIQPSQGNFKAYEKILKNATPLVMVDRECQDQPTSVAKVVTNNFSSSLELGVELGNRGYQSIVLICRIKAISAQTQRINGFQKAAEANRVHIQVINTDGHDDSWLAKQLSKAMGNRQQKTVFVTLMGPLLFKLLTFFKKNHLTFPIDAGLLSFDDWDWSQFVGDGIDLMEQNPMEMGRRAGKLLYQAINQENDPDLIVDQVPAKRIAGSSL